MRDAVTDPSPVCVFDVRGVPTSCVQMVLFGCFASSSVYLN